MSNTEKWLLAAAVVLGVIAYLYTRSRQASAAAAGTDISSPIARGMRYVTEGTDKFGNRFGRVGNAVTATITGAPGNVLRGDTKATLWSAATGGLSDIGSALGI